jgi:hypothetical protein
MAGISDKAVKTQYAENKYRFQKQELQNKEFSDGSGLEMYEFKYRMDDPQIGRFWSVDPLASKYVYNSPYAFSEDKVTNAIELEGLEAVPLSTSLWRAAGISSSTDAKEFVKDVGKEALKPSAWAEGYAQAGGLVAPLALIGIMTGGTGDGAMLDAELGSSSLRAGLGSVGVGAVGEGMSVTSEATTASIEGGASGSAGTINIADQFSLKATSTGDVPLQAPQLNSPGFIVDGQGTAFPVPSGATGPTPVINPAGNQTGVAFTGGSGGENGKVTTMRLMDPTPARGSSPGYSNGYIKYENATKQGVNPYTGKTVPNTQSHYPINH